MPLITIARELGSQGNQIASAVAAQFGVPLVDQQVPSEMARQLGVPVSVIMQTEERLLAKPLVSAEMRDLLGAQRSGLGTLNEAQFMQHMRAAIQQLAAAGQGVFLGRGAQLILKEAPTALHVHLYAPPQVRAVRLQQRRALPNVETALHLVQQGDEQRKNWYRHFFSGIDWKNPRHYHLLIDTACLPPPVATALIVQAAQATASPTIGSE